MIQGLDLFQIGYFREDLLFTPNQCLFVCLFFNREPTSVCLCGLWASWSLLFLSLSHIKKLIKLFLISYRNNSLPWQGDGVLIYSQNEKTFDAGICIRSKLFPIFFSLTALMEPTKDTGRGPNLRMTESLGNR